MFPTADRPLVIAVGNDTIWRRFAPLIGVQATDGRFATNQLRIENRVELESLISERFRTRVAAAWLADLARAAVPAGEVKSLDGVYGSQQVMAEGLVREVDHPTLGTIRLPGTPLRFSRSGEPAHRPPPLLGEHSRSIRAEWQPAEPAV
jgi:crotonobetainyl-CoA:carnitine CoA-transferase CaiB-like acyl-CoA transferase